MKKIIKFGFLAVFCTLYAFNLYSQSDTKSNISVYFVYSNNSSVGSSQAALKILINDFLNYPEIKKFAVLAKSDAKLSKNLKRDFRLDGVLINDGKTTYKGVELKSTQDILVFGDDDALIQQYSNFSQMNELLFTSGKVQELENHKLNPKMFGECSVVLPVDDDKKGSINLILPEDGKMICLRNKPKKITEAELPNYFDCFYYYGHTVQSKIYRDDQIKNAPIVVEKYYKRFDNNIALIKELTTGFGDTTGLYITSKNAALKMDSSVMIFREIDQDKLSKMLKKDFYLSQNIGLRATARLNDSLMAAMLIKTPGNTNHLGLIDMQTKTMKIAKDLDGVMNSDSLFYIRFSGDKNNKLYMMNIKSNELKIIDFKSPTKPTVKNNKNFLQNGLANRILDIYASDKVLYVFYFHPTNPNSLYMEEYKTDDFSFARGYNLPINPNEMELINIAGIVDKLIYFLYQDSGGAWMMKSFRVL